MGMPGGAVAPEQCAVLTTQLSSPLPEISPGDVKTYAHAEGATCQVTAALFIALKTASSDVLQRRTAKLRYIHTRKYYPVIKTNALGIPRMNFRRTKGSPRSQTQKTTC